MRHATTLAIAIALAACVEPPTAMVQPGQVVVSAGSSHTCAITIYFATYCWGSNRYGQLGVGTTDTLAHSTPLRVTTAPSFVLVSAGEHATCALTAAAAAYCWGYNGTGMLGTGDTLPRLTPTAVSGSHHFVAISVGTSHVCALKSDGAAFCWGQGIYGQLGTGGNASSNVPVAVGGALAFTSLSAGETHTCGVAVSGLATSGVAHCWGYNAHGALGSGQPPAAKLLPTAVAGGQTFTMVSLGFRYSCGVAAGAYCWGLNLSGQLGAATPNSCLGFSDDFFPCSTTPLLVPVSAALQSIVTGGAHTCAMIYPGDVWCWGANGAGQLGDGTTAQQRQSPAKVAGEIAFARISAGGIHSCGVAKTSVLYCWGGNWAGQIGDGSTISRSAPVPVTLP